MKALLIDRNGFKKVVDLPQENMMNAYHIPVSMLNIHENYNEMMEQPLPSRTTTRMFERRRTKIIGNEKVIILKEV